jgi:CMP/dCMP kinase
MIVTISGLSGSGKSTIARNLEKEFKAKRIYVGGIRREMARERNMSLMELNEYAKTHPETDVEVDKKASTLAEEIEKNERLVIVEGRVQFHFLPQSVKIFIKVSTDEGARRVWQDLQDKKTSEQRNEGSFSKLEDLKESIKQRDKEDADRYMMYYNVNHLDENQYDFVLDTTRISAKQATDKVIQFLKEQQNL